MTETCEEFAVYRFVRDLFEDVSLTFPALGCTFEGTIAPNALTARAAVQSVKNQLFLLFAGLATGLGSLSVRFKPEVRGTNVDGIFFCEPFDLTQANHLPSWDPQVFRGLDPSQGTGFWVTWPLGQPSEPGPPLDWQKLDQLYGGQGAGRRVLETFLARCPVLLDDVGGAIATGDSSGLLRAAHTIKGSARGVTAYSLAEVAFQLETLGRSGDLTTAPDLYKGLRDTYHVFMDWVQEGPQ